VAQTPRPSADQHISVGQVFLGKYRVEEILGQGGMGVVARCTHLALNEQVAIKMLRHDVLSDEDAKQRFVREAQAAVKLRSEYVARVSDVGTFENGVPYMVMEYLDGQDLGVLIEEQGQVAVPWAVELMLQAAEALAEAHSINIVHRDVKPTNLFVTWRPDGTSLIKVLDFGISKSAAGTDMQLTQTQSLLGTPAYMSPEQMRSARLVDQRTDIWSLGTVLYELLEGRRPFEAESFSEMCVKVAVDAPAPMVNTPPALQQVVLRCLAKAPEQRYASMADLGRDLIPFARDQHSAAMLVERMTRMLGRATPAGWENLHTGAGQRQSMGSPRAQTPIPWHGGSDPSGSRFTPVPGPVPVPMTHREPSAPARMPSELHLAPRRSRLAWVLVTLLLAAGAAAVAVVVMSAREEAAATPATTEPAATVAPAITPPLDAPAATVDTPSEGSAAPTDDTAAAGSGADAAALPEVKDEPGSAATVDEPTQTKPRTTSRGSNRRGNGKRPGKDRKDPKATETKPTETKPADTKPTETKPTETKPAFDPFSSPRAPRP